MRVKILFVCKDVFLVSEWMLLLAAVAGHSLLWTHIWRHFSQIKTYFSFWKMGVKKLDTWAPRGYVTEEYGKETCSGWACVEGSGVSYAKDTWYCCISVLQRTGHRHVCQQTLDENIAPLQNICEGTNQCISRTLSCIHWIAAALTRRWDGSFM